MATRPHAMSHGYDPAYGCVVARMSDGSVRELCRCGRATTEEQQHGTVRHEGDSGDGVIHDGGCDVCCVCVPR